MDNRTTYVIIFIFRKDCEPFFQEEDELVFHFIKLVNVAVRVHVAKTGADRIIHEEQVGKLIPRTVVVLKFPAWSHPIRAYFHERTIHGAASWTTVHPYHGPLLVRNVTVLV